MSLHLVVKRGHHGRFRFVLLGDGERITGEVRVDVADSGRTGPRALALAKIAKLAEALLAGVATHPAIDEPRAETVDDPTHVDQTDPRRRPTLDEGDPRGQI